MTDKQWDELATAFRSAPVAIGRLGHGELVTALKHLKHLEQLGYKIIPPMPPVQSGRG